MTTLLLGACSESNDPDSVQAEDDPAGTAAGNPAGGANGNPDGAGAPAITAAGDLGATSGIYDSDGYATVDVQRVDVRTEVEPGNCTGTDQSGCTLADVMNDVNGDDDVKVEIPVHLVAADYPEDGLVSNATLRQRGGFSRRAPQKSFRVRLDESDVLWRGERTLQLNKHPYDSTRIRNKVSFELMSGMPHLYSLRTQFVNLWIDDGAGPLDYGLFTHIEKTDKRYFERRGLDEDDNLYKAEFSDFSLTELEYTRTDSDGQPLNKALFESSYEIENGEDHRALNAMLTDFHDPSRTFESVLSQYFNRDNVLTWVAVNFLLRQSDAVTKNFILYNPKGTEHLYFLPWDYDGALYAETEPTNTLDNQALGERLLYGYARGSSNQFLNRLYRLPGIHDEILAAARDLRNNWLTDARVEEITTRAEAVARPLIQAWPDNVHNPEYSPTDHRQFGANIGANLDSMADDFGIPMPAELSVPEQVGSELVFQWSPATDVTGNGTLAYELLVSRSLGFDEGGIVYQASDIADSVDVVEHRVPADRLGSGRMYARVIARSSSNPERNWQVNRNSVTDNGTVYYGRLGFDLP